MTNRSYKNYKIAPIKETKKKKSKMNTQSEKNINDAFQHLPKSGGLIVIKGKCLMVKGIKSGKWGMPKGSISSYSELSFDAMIRELKEETGMELLKYKYEINEKISCLGSKNPSARSIVYFIEVDSDDIPKVSPPLEKNGSRNREISKAEWVNLDNINDLDLNIFTKSNLSKSQKYRKYIKPNKK